ncbi:MAG: thioredoxin family protein [Bacilli bacterium]|nr:thioredoxin family protein [Bacilli bacterium]
MDKKKIKLIIEIVLFVGALGALTFAYYFSGNDTPSMEEMAEVGIVKITDDNFEAEVKNADKPVILEFFSNSCPPCLTMIPTMINIAKNYDDVKVATVNSSEDDTKKIVEEYDISAYPTIIIFKDGSVQKAFMGATSEENIMKEINGEN